MNNCRKISALLVIGMLLFLIVACLCTQSGCWLKNGIDAEGHIRPAKPNVPPVPAVPAPPAPPKDDWAPPWFRRPQPKKRGLSSSVPSAVLGDASAAVSMMLTTTAAREEAVNPAAVDSYTPVADVKPGAEAAYSKSPAIASLAETMLADNNAIRAAANRLLRPHKLNDRLCRAAQDHADYMARHHQPRPNRMYFNTEYRHDSNGGGCMARANRHGFYGQDVRENLNLCLPGDPIDVWPSWCNSASHYRTILSTCEEVGFAVSQARDGSTYWVAVYGRESAGAE